MLEALKTFIKIRFPRLALRLRRITHRLHMWKFNRREGLNKLARRYFVLNGTRVQAGPFREMIYIRSAAGSSLVPKLAGSYELELAPALEKIFATDYACIVNVGCAEGYYAVGLALRLPRVRVIAFDIDRRARKLCKKLAVLNGVADRITIRAACDGEALSSALTPRALVVCDCEGYEAILLDPSIVHELKNADLLVELHEHVVPNCAAMIQERFAPTHDLQLFGPLGRDPNSFPSLAGLSPEDRRVAVNEFRTADQRWAFITARDVVEVAPRTTSSVL